MPANDTHAFVIGRLEGRVRLLGMGYAMGMHTVVGAAADLGPGGRSGGDRRSEAIAQPLHHVHAGGRIKGKGRL